MDYQNYCDMKNDFKVGETVRCYNEKSFFIGTVLRIDKNDEKIIVKERYYHRMYRISTKEWHVHGYNIGQEYKYGEVCEPHGLRNAIFGVFIGVTAAIILLAFGMMLVAIWSQSKTFAVLLAAFGILGALCLYLEIKKDDEIRDL